MTPKTSKQVLSLGLRGGLKVIIVRGWVSGDEHGVNGVVDVGGTVVVELGGGEEVDGRDEELMTVDELYREAEELPGGEGMGDKRKLRIGRDSTGLDREGDSWLLS